MHAVFGKAIEFSGGEYGCAILSKFPIEDSSIVALPTGAGREDRVAVLAEVSVQGKPIVFAGTHLSHEKGSSEIRSKAQALSQCRDWLDQTFSSRVKRVATTSSSEAAQDAKNSGKNVAHQSLGVYLDRNCNGGCYTT